MYNLYHGSQILETHRKISDYNLPCNTCLDMRKVEPAGTEIRKIQTVDSSFEISINFKKFHVKPTDTIAEIKAKICEKFVFTGDCLLLFNGRILGGSKTFSDYRITNGSDLYYFKT